MDGPQAMMGGGGFEAGSAFVTVSADLSPLRAGIAEAHSMLAGLAGGGVSVPIGGGGAGGGLMAGSMPSPAGGTTFSGFTGLPTAGLPIAGTFAGFAGLPAAPSPEPYEVNEFSGGGEFMLKPLDAGGGVAARSGMSWYSAGAGSAFGRPAASPRGGGMPGPGGGDGGSRNLWQNLRLLGLAAAGIGAIGRTGSAIGSALYESQYLADHPGAALAEFDYAHTGAGYSGSTLALAAESQGISAALARRQAVASVPVLGMMAGWSDFGEGSGVDLRRRQQLLGAESGVIDSTAELNFRIAGLSAHNSGDPVAIAQAAFASQIAGAEKTSRAAGSAFADYAVSHAGSIGGESVAADGTRYGSTSGNAKELQELDRLGKEASDAANALSSLKAAANASVAEVARGQRNEVASLQAGTNLARVSLNGGMAAVRTATLGVMDNEAGIALNEYSVHPTEANFARWQAASQKASNYRSESQAEIDVANSTTASNYATGVQNANYRSFVARQQFEGGFQESALGAGVYGFQARRDSFGASMQGIAAARAGASRIPVAIDRGIALGTIDQQEAALVAEHAFGMQVAGEGYAARTSAAQMAGNLQSMSAQATMEVARARHEVAMAPPELRGQVMSTVAAELASQAKLTTMQRGGNVALDVSGYEAMGMMSAFGMDLTGRTQDRKRAGQILHDGQGNLGSSPQAGGGTQTVNDPVVAKLLNDLLKKLTGANVTMFKSN